MFDASLLDAPTALALLQWQIELGADEALSETPVNRFEIPETAERPARLAAVAGLPAASETVATDPVAEAQALALSAGTIEELAEAMRGFDRSDLKRSARSFVFADGNPAARVMVIGEAPGVEEDRTGLPFVGPAGQLLDRMFASIGLSRTAPDPAAGLYITNALPWRPAGNRTPTAEEIALFRPFLVRHVALADPEVLVLMGNVPCQSLLGRTGILSMRGKWAEALSRPAMPMTHPAYLLRVASAKREAWADLLELKARLGAAR